MKSATYCAVPGRPFLSVLRYCRPYWRQYLFGTFLSLLFIFIGLCLPLAIRSFVHRFELPQDDPDYMTHSRLMIYFAILVAIPVLAGIVRYFQRLITIGASREVEYDIRGDFFRHIQSLSQDFFHRTKTGDIMARATNDLNYVRMLIGPGIMGGVDILRIPFALVLLFHIDAKLALIALAPMPLVSLIVYAFMMYMHKQSKTVHEQFSSVTSRAQENLSGARVVKAYGIADREQESFNSESHKYIQENMKLAAVMNLLWPLIGMMLALSTLLPLWQGGLMVIRGETSVSNVIGFISCLHIMLWPLVRFGWLLTIYQRGAVSMNRLSEIFSEIPEIRDHKSTRHDIKSIEGSVSFKNVYFKYGDRTILEDISFEVPKGKTIAIVGPTGCGKSSVVSLITREINPSSGTVLIDGVDLRCIPLSTLRNAIGYVPQDTFLFSDTIRANMTIGYHEASQEEIDEASSAAQFKQTVDELDKSYDTLLGERGVNLSGGQKQRLAIARAIIRNPKILILDDSLSSVDTQTEEMILQNLKQISSTRTSIIISHRVSTIRHSDEIIVIDNGRLAERGTHDQLTRNGGIYARMYERQQLEEELAQE